MDSEKKTEEPEKTENTKPDEKAAEKAVEDVDKEKKEEPLFEMLDNPARAIPTQVSNQLHRLCVQFCYYS